MWWILGLMAVLALPVRPDVPVDELLERYAPAPSQFKEVWGMEVHCRDQGQGLPVLFLHGMGSSLHTWEGWTNTMLQAGGYRVISVDMPGWGLTGPDPKKRYRIEDQVAFLDALADSLGLQQFVIGGNSMGGWFSWNYALAHPNRLKGLILVDAAGLSQPQTESQEPAKSKRPAILQLNNGVPGKNYLRQATPRFIYKGIVKQVYANDDLVTRELVNRYYRLMRREGNRQAFLDRASQRAGSKNRQAELSSLQIPTLILWGSQDPWIPLSHGKQFQELIPGSVLVEFPHLGHVPMEEDPANTVVPVLGFLAGLK